MFKDNGAYRALYRSLNSGSPRESVNANWDGTKWVQVGVQPSQQTYSFTKSVSTASNGAPLPSTDLPKVPSHMTALDPNSTPVADLVRHYSAIYQYWAEQVALFKSGNQSGADLEWSEYYADLSTRAAHHYNGILQKTTTASNSSSTHITAPSPPPPPPQSFQDYAHRNLKRCSNQTQKSAMTELIQLTIQKAFQNQTMQTTDWHKEPLLPLPSCWGIVEAAPTYTKATEKNSVGNESLTGSSKKKRSRSQFNSYDEELPLNDSYYGALGRTSSSITKTSPKGKKKTFGYESKLPRNDSYYGRAQSSDRSIPTEHKNQVSSQGEENLTSIQKKKAKKKTNTSPQSSNQDTEEDYIALSSLSTAKYMKTKRNKLVKVKPTTNTSSIQLTATKAIHSNNLEISKSKLTSRANRFAGNGGLSTASSKKLHSVYSQDVDRYMGKTVIGGNAKKFNEEDYEHMTVKGMCQNLEKDYLRLTAPPRAELVRPQSVLQKHLANLQNSWKQLSFRKASGKPKKKKQRDYIWFCSQLKAIRQDLTVQRIFNSFAIEVYETHARIALEEGDLNEYNQSQTQLKELYELIIHENEDNENEYRSGLKNQNEFIAYRIIYYVLLTGNKKYDGGSSDLFKIMLSLRPEQRKDPFILHALQVRVAVADNDYHSFFRLQDKCPNLGAYLMDKMVGQVRSGALQCMITAYRPSLPVGFILNELGFCFNGELDLEEGLQYLKDCGCKLNEDETLVLTKDSAIKERNSIKKQESSLI